MLVECLELRRKWLFKSELNAEQRRVSDRGMPELIGWPEDSSGCLAAHVLGARQRPWPAKGR